MEKKLRIGNRNRYNDDSKTFMKFLHKQDLQYVHFHTNLKIIVKVYRSEKMTTTDENVPKFSFKY